MGQMIEMLQAAEAETTPRQPFFISGTIHADHRECFSGWAVDYVVPAGKRLVVEFIGVVGSDETPAVARSGVPTYTAKVRNPGGDERDCLYLPMMPWSRPADSSIAQCVRLEYDPGQHLAISVARLPVSDETLSGHAYVSVSGHLVAMD